MSTPPRSVHEAQGFRLGLLGVCGFSLTLPMTRIAVRELDPLLVGLGRSMISVVLAAAYLAYRHDPFPGRRHLPSLLTIALGVIVGFPVLSAFALREVPASHGAVIVALLPLFTALCGSLRAHERPSAAFWLAALAGSSAVIAYIVLTSGFNPTRADLLLLGAVVTCAVGYAEGGRLSRELGGLRVISWSLVVACPFLAVPVGLTAWNHGLHASWTGWAALAYMGVISMYLAFWAWYEGLALGGVARVSQAQLLQPFMTIGFAWIVLGEALRIPTLLAALFVVASVALGRRASILHGP